MPDERERLSQPRSEDSAEVPSPYQDVVPTEAIPNAGEVAPSAEQVEALASSLLWRIGRAYDDGPLTVRVGFASAAPLFADLPRLRPASDLEVEVALQSGDVSVEWVGPKGAARS